MSVDRAQIEHLRSFVATPRCMSYETIRSLDDILDNLEAASSEVAALRRQVEERRVVVPEQPERVEQSILHDPPSSYGNCFSAMLAGLLRIPLEHVPHFSDPRVTSEDNWRKEVNAWLCPMGLAMMDGIDLSAEDWKVYGTDGCWHILTGASPRNPTVSHAIAGKDGADAWDPHPSQDGLSGDARWSCLFVALRPWEVASRRPLSPGEVVVGREEWAALGQIVTLVNKHINDPCYLRNQLVPIVDRVSALRSGEAGKEREA